MALKPAPINIDCRIPRNVIHQILGGPVKTLVEVGVHCGDNAFEMWYYLRPDKTWLIDPWSSSHPAGYGGNTQADWDECYEFVKSRFSTFNNIEILRTTSEEGSKVLPNDLDFVYIDADHSYESCSLDISLWWPKVRDGGILGGDDYSYDTVVKAVHEFMTPLVRSNPEYRLFISPSKTQWWVIKQKKNSFIIR